MSLKKQTSRKKAVSKASDDLAAAATGTVKSKRIVCDAPFAEHVDFKNNAARATCRCSRSSSSSCGSTTPTRSCATA